MTKYEGRDHYLNPETGVLKNKLGLKDEEGLQQAEASFVAWRIFQLHEKPLPGKFDFEHFKGIHKILFSDLYDWAGQIRDIDLAKGNSYFASHVHILSAATPIFEKLRGEAHLKGLGVEDFSVRAAYYLGELNALHPFREGNGRAQREFINHLAYENGYTIEWTNISQEDMLQASIVSFHQGDTTKFAALIRENLILRSSSDHND